MATWILLRQERGSLLPGKNGIARRRTDTAAPLPLHCFFATKVPISEVGRPIARSENGFDSADRCSAIAPCQALAHRHRMTSDFTKIILQVIERAPQWMRRDLDAKDAVARIQAEESLAAMIADALEKQESAAD